uniref:ATP synthase F0 subunit 8 n=1 Tax=Entylia carinata TaxID=1464891 RepID=A0A343AXP3_ENTCR|nr:ATP synthase F0 subunit 8 [Entylia carinata]APU51891.1 ATP synthase F0 subunit 8 [Entylia carinata]
MSPMWWLSLMLMFNMVLMMMNTTIYFEKKNLMKISKKLFNKKMNWKW